MFCSIRVRNVYELIWRVRIVNVLQFMRACEVDQRAWVAAMTTAIQERLLRLMGRRRTKPAGDVTAARVDKPRRIIAAAARRYCRRYCCCCCCSQCSVDWRRLPSLSSIHAPSSVQTTSVSVAIVYLVYLPGLPGLHQQRPAINRNRSPRVRTRRSPRRRPEPIQSLFIDKFAACRLFPLSISCCILSNSAFCMLIKSFSLAIYQRSLCVLF